MRVERKKQEKKKKVNLGLYVEIGETRDHASHVEAVNRALSEFSKKVKRSGLMNDLRAREHFVQPSMARRLKHNSAVRRAKFNQQ